MAKKLGIIGGMGPAATAQLFTRVVELTDVACDQDHINITILNNPKVPDRTAYLLGKEGAQSFVPVLNAAALKLEADGCDVLIMPCNTSHSRYDDIVSGLHSAQLIHMPRETAKFLKDLGCKKAGILATTGTVTVGVYQKALEEEGVDFALPASQDTVMSVIYDYVKAGKPAKEGLFESVCDELVAAGCDALILGCTELSLLGMPSIYSNALVIDALDVLAYRAIQACDTPAKDLTAQYR